jgi:hypothetical protein
MTSDAVDMVNHGENLDDGMTRTMWHLTLVLLHSGNA